MSLLLRGLITAVTLALALCLLAPWLAYEITLARLERLPERPAQLAAPARQAAIWQRAGGEGPLVVEPVNPYGFMLALVARERVRPGEELASWVARDHLRQLPSTGMLAWQLRNAVLTVWLTRHWSAAELATAADAAAGRSAARP